MASLQRGTVLTNINLTQEELNTDVIPAGVIVGPNGDGTYETRIIDGTHIDLDPDKDIYTIDDNIVIHHLDLLLDYELDQTLVNLGLQHRACSGKFYNNTSEIKLFYDNALAENADAIANAFTQDKLGTSKELAGEAFLAVIDKKYHRMSADWFANLYWSDEHDDLTCRHCEEPIVDSAHYEYNKQRVKHAASVLKSFF